MWLPLNFEHATGNGRVLIGTFSIGGLAAVVSAILMLPSISSPKPSSLPKPLDGQSDPLGESHAASSATGYISGLIVIPLLLAATCNAICWAAYRAGFEHLRPPEENWAAVSRFFSWPEPTGPSFIVGSVLYYVLAACIVWAVAQWRKKPNPPRFFRLIPVMAVIGVLVGTFSLGVTKINGFGNPALQSFRLYVVLSVPLLLLHVPRNRYALRRVHKLGPSSRHRRRPRVVGGALMGTVLICIVVWVVLSAISLYGGMLCDRVIKGGSWPSVLSVCGTVLTGALGLMGGGQCGLGECSSRRRANPANPSDASCSGNRSAAVSNRIPDPVCLGNRESVTSRVGIVPRARRPSPRGF
jgi:hypothetical protein